MQQIKLLSIINYTYAFQLQLLHFEQKYNAYKKKNTLHMD